MCRRSGGVQTGTYRRCLVGMLRVATALQCYALFRSVKFCSARFCVVEAYSLCVPCEQGTVENVKLLSFVSFFPSLIVSVFGGRLVVTCCKRQQSHVGCRIWQVRVLVCTSLLCGAISTGSLQRKQALCNVFSPSFSWRGEGVVVLAVLSVSRQCFPALAKASKESHLPQKVVA